MGGTKSDIYGCSAAGVGRGGRVLVPECPEAHVIINSSKITCMCHAAYIMMISPFLQFQTIAKISPSVPEAHVPDPHVPDPRVLGAHVPDPRVPDPRVLGVHVPDPHVPDPRVPVPAFCILLTQHSSKLIGD